MGEVLRCRLTYEDDAPSAPDSVIVKLPSPHPKNLKMSKLLQLYKREYSFYIRLAPHVPIHVAALYYGDFEEKTHRFVLVLEDMRGMETGNRIEGATERQAKVAIRAIARLHGSILEPGRPAPCRRPALFPPPQVPASGPVGLSALACPRPQEFW